MEATFFCCTLILAGAIVYGSNDQAGALRQACPRAARGQGMMAAGGALVLLRWLWQTFFKNRLV